MLFRSGRGGRSALRPYRAGQAILATADHRREFRFTGVTVWLSGVAGCFDIVKRECIRFWIGRCCPGGLFRKGRVLPGDGRRLVRVANAMLAGLTAGWAIGCVVKQEVF